MKKNYWKEVSIFVILSMLVLLVFSGCGGTSGKAQQDSVSTANAESVQSASTQDSAPAPASNEKVKITYWHTYGDAEEPFFNDTVLPLFKEKYPNIEVESLRQEVSQFNQLITTSFGTHQTPDIARVDLTNVASYAKQGGIIALDNMEGFAEVKSKLLEGPLATNLYNGKYYGLPLDTNTKAAVVNMKVMKKLGLNEPPKTIEEFINISKKMSPGKYTISVSSVGDWDIYPYFWLFGGALTDDQFTKATGYMDSPQSIAALQKILDLHNEKVLTVKDIDGTADAWDGIGKGEYAMFYDGPWFFAVFSDWKDKEIVPAPIPTFNGQNTSVVGGEDIVIFKDSKNPKEAFEFMKFLLSDEVQMLMVSKGQMPVLKSAIDKEQIKKSPVLSVYQKQLETAKARIPSPQSSAISQIWGDAVTSALKGQATAEQALKKAAVLIDAELSK